MTFASDWTNTAAAFWLRIKVGSSRREVCPITSTFSFQSAKSCRSPTMRLVKTNSSKWVHETFPELGTFGWQAGYGAFSVSYSGLDSVKKYIANQAKHHREIGFKEEFIALLKRHDLVFDERYLWD